MVQRGLHGAHQPWVELVCPAACLSWSRGRSMVHPLPRTRSHPWLEVAKGISTVAFLGSSGMFGSREAGCEYSPETGGSA